MVASDDNDARAEWTAASHCDVHPDTRTPNAAIHRTPITDKLPTPPLERSATHKTTSLPNTSRITTLKAFLSRDNLTSTHPTLHTANTIRSLYLSAEARSQLNDLSARELSVLISLFGSLSLSTPGLPYRSIYAHPFTQAISERHPQGFCRSYWPMVAQLVSAKVSLYRKLGPSDCYHAMRGQLAGVLEAVNKVKTQGVSH